MISNIFLIIIIIIVIVFFFHSKKYYYQNKELSIEQLETYNYKNVENIKGDERDTKINNLYEGLI